MNVGTKIDFSPRAIQFTMLAEALVVLSFCFLFFETGTNLFVWLFPTMLGVAVIGMKFIAPKIPRNQLIVLFLIILIIPFIFNFLAAHISSWFFFASDLAIPLVCVSVFGAYWVKQGYIPSSVNRW
jgi:hypothetical protein